MKTTRMRQESHPAEPGTMAMTPEIWRYIFDAIEDPVFLIDAEARVLLTNRAYCRESGVTEAEALGKPYWEVFPRGCGAPLERRDAVIGKSDTRSQEEVIIGAKRFLFKAYTVRDEQGEQLYSLRILSDITAERLAREALAESEERWRLATETARDAIITLDGKGGTVTAWNPAAETMFGYSKDEAVGRTLHDFLPPARFRVAAQGGMAHFAATGQGEVIGKTIELQARHKDGTEFPIELSLSATQINGNRLATGIARDISERKRTENLNLRFGQMYRTISRCNKVLVHAGDELELAREMCRVLTEEGGLLAAWVGYAETSDAKRILPIAVAGTEESEIAAMNLTWEDNEDRREPTGTAVRTGKIVVSQDILNDPLWAPWREQAIKRGYAAAATFPLKIDQRVLGALDIYGAQADVFEPDMLELLAELAGDLAFGIDNLRSRAERMGILEKLEHSLDHAVAAIAATVELRDPYTAGHQRRVAKLATAIASEMGLAVDRVQGLHMGSVVHDIGKIHVPAEILANPGKLTDAEFAIIKTHCQAGYDILKEIDFSWPVAEMVYQHHEKLDGSGYPRHLKGEEILLEARILSVADVVEAMSSHRPYRPGFGIFPALQEISRNKGRLYDLRVVEACLRLFMEKNYEW
jgi:PAS domain S-box-containing protein/putative nucleotidyltransferase with HDIG domain